MFLFFVGFCYIDEMRLSYNAFVVKLAQLRCAHVLNRKPAASLAVADPYKLAMPTQAVAGV